MSILSTEEERQIRAEGETNANALLNTLREIVSRQNELRNRVEYLEELLLITSGREQIQQ
jgi:hypothetical protein